MTSFRAVVFDRDGVLTRFDFTPLVQLLSEIPGASFEALWRLWHDYYENRPLPRTRAEEQQFLAAFWDTVATAWALEPAMHTRLVSFDYTRTILAFDDARKALTEARKRGLRVGVLSNFPLVSLEESLVSTGLADLVDVAIAASISGAPKPNRQAYESMLNALEVEPEACLFIDDEEKCVDGARALGIRSYRLDRTMSADTSLPPFVLPNLLDFGDVLSSLSPES
jgi:putative hydrolase of the HAD superfamily